MLYEYALIALLAAFFVLAHLIVRTRAALLTALYRKVRHCCYVVEHHTRDESVYNTTEDAAALIELST